MKLFYFVVIVSTIWCSLAGLVVAQPNGPLPHGGIKPYFYWSNHWDDKTISDQEFDAISQTYIVGWKWDTTLPQADQVWIPTSPTIDLIDCTFEEASPFFVYNGSTMNVVGPKVWSGTFDGLSISASDASKINIMGGTVHDISGFGESKITLTDASLQSFLFYDATNEATLTNVLGGGVQTGAIGGGTVTINGDSILGGIHTRSGTIDMIGGEVGSAEAFLESTDETKSSKIVLTGTHVKGVLEATGGRATLTNGQVDGEIAAAGSPTGQHGGVFVTGSDTHGATALQNGFFSIDACQVHGDVTVVDGSLGILNAISGDSAIFGNLKTKGQGNLLLEGGLVAGNVEASDQSLLVMSSPGAIIGHLLKVSGGTVRMKAGLVTESAVVLGTGQFMMEGGRVGLNAQASGNSILEISGGMVSGSIVAYEKSTVNLSGGTIAEIVTTSGSMGSKVTLEGSVHVQGNVQATGPNRVNVLGGQIDGSLVGFEDSITVMSGGHVAGAPIFFGNATFLYSGGTFGFGMDQPAGGSSLRSLAGGAGGDPMEMPQNGFLRARQQLHSIHWFSLAVFVARSKFSGAVQRVPAHWPNGRRNEHRRRNRLHPERHRCEIRIA